MKQNVFRNGKLSAGGAENVVEENFPCHHLWLRECFLAKLCKVEQNPSPLVMICIPIVSAIFPGLAQGETPVRAVDPNLIWDATTLRTVFLSFAVSAAAKGHKRTRT